MEYINRKIDSIIQKIIARDKSILLLGPRQTGKTTPISHITHNLYLSFADPGVRIRYEKEPATLIGEVSALPKTNKNIRPLVIIDEVQKVPDIMDSIQILIDKKQANFILTGSSARKLRRTNQNMLPGRLIPLKLDPLSLNEMKPSKLPASRGEVYNEAIKTPPLKDLLLFGTLPGIWLTQNKLDKETDLNAYTTIYLEEEVRAESLVRQLGPFARFLELAAAENGQIINLHKLSQEIGVAHTTISAYFSILEDCLIIKRISPLTKSKTRKKLTRTDKYLFFDLGVRRLAAKEGVHLPRASWGPLFEQWVGLELSKLIHLSGTNATLRFFRDPTGPEVDWIIEHNQRLIPIEVKWHDNPTLKDAKHLCVFLKEYPQARKGFIVCQTPRPIKLAKNILAIPWASLPEFFNEQIKA